MTTEEMIIKWFENRRREELRPTCPYCGWKLSKYWYNSFKGLRQVQICQKCNKKVVKE